MIADASAIKSTLVLFNLSMVTTGYLNIARTALDRWEDSNLNSPCSYNLILGGMAGSAWSRACPLMMSIMNASSLVSTLTLLRLLEERLRNVSFVSIAFSTLPQSES